MDREELNNEKALLIKKRNRENATLGNGDLKLYGYQVRGIQKRIDKITARITEIDVELARDK